MALTYDLTRIKDKDAMWDGPGDDAQLTSKTTSIIFATIGVGMPVIEEGNWEDFYVRSRMQDMAFGWNTPSFTPDDVKRHVGLRTNATPKTYAKFRGEVSKQLRERMNGEIAAYHRAQLATAPASE